MLALSCRLKISGVSLMAWVDLEYSEDSPRVQWMRCIIQLNRSFYGLIGIFDSLFHHGRYGMKLF